MRLLSAATVLLPILLVCACGNGGKGANGCGERKAAHAVVYRVGPGPGAPVTQANIAATVHLLCERARGRLAVHRLGTNEIELGSRDPITVPVLDVVASLAFYDWEPNLLSRGQFQPSISLFAAAKFASRQRARAEAADIPPGGPAPRVTKMLGNSRSKIEHYYDRENDTAGDKYYVFGPGRGIGRKLLPAGLAGQASGSFVAVAANPASLYYRSCSDIADDYRPGSSNSMVTSGPLARGTACLSTLKSLAREGRGPPPGSVVVKVPRGIVVVKDEQRTSNASFGYWVLEDDAELTSNDIRDPQQSFDPQTDEPLVQFNFTPRGKAAFRRVTRREARRGAAIIRAPGTDIQSTFQTFAITLDNQLVSRATVDYQQYPDGIPADTGAQIGGLRSIPQAQDLAATLKYRPPPLGLTLVRVR